VEGFCKHGNELSSSIKGEEYFEYLSVLDSFSGRTLFHRVSYFKTFFSFRV
jgi:hypothetical protein